MGKRRGSVPGGVTRKNPAAGFDSPLISTYAAVVGFVGRGRGMRSDILLYRIDSKTLMRQSEYSTVSGTRKITFKEKDKISWARGAEAGNPDPVPSSA